MLFITCAKYTRVICEQDQRVQCHPLRVITPDTWEMNPTRVTPKERQSCHELEVSYMSLLPSQRQVHSLYLKQHYIYHEDNTPAESQSSTR